MTSTTSEAGWLIDKSALVRLGGSIEADAWAGRIQRGLVRIATVTRLEVGCSAQNAGDLRAGLREPPVGSMPIELRARLRALMYHRPIREWYTLWVPTDHPRTQVTIDPELAAALDQLGWANERSRAGALRDLALEGARARLEAAGHKDAGRAYLRAIATGEVDYDFDALAEIHAARGAHLQP